MASPEVHVLLLMVLLMLIPHHARAVPPNEVIDVVGHEGAVCEDGRLRLGRGHLLQVTLHQQRLPPAHKPVLLSGKIRGKILD